MKRLDENTKKNTVPIATGHKIGKLAANHVFVTETIHSKEEAVDAKLQSVQPKILGINLVNYKQKGMRKVWVPCYFMIYDFKVKRNVFFNKTNAFDKEGRVGVVYDANEMHASHYDVLTDGELPLKQIPESSLDGIVLPDGGSKKEIVEGAENSIRRQILFKAYKTMDSELKQIKMVKFYRQAWEMEMTYKDRTYVKYAYLDDYGVQNEKARGLNARLSGM